MESWMEKIRKSEEHLKEQTLVELVGRKRVLVEHHKGILGYSKDEILVGTEEGVLRVEGDNLCLCCMSREQLFVSGTIRSLVCEGRES